MGNSSSTAAAFYEAMFDELLLDRDPRAVARKAARELRAKPPEVFRVVVDEAMIAAMKFARLAHQAAGMTRAFVPGPDSTPLQRMRAARLVDVPGGAHEAITLASGIGALGERMLTLATELDRLSRGNSDGRSSSARH